MDKITISNLSGTISVTMPRTKSIQILPVEVSRRSEMASGKIVKDKIGTRQTLTATYDYVPVNTLTTLNNLLLSNGFVRVNYPTVGGSAEGIFEILPITPTVFGYIDGVPIWHNIMLAMTSQDVS